MNSYTIREYSPQDVPQMSALWQAVFGDSADFVGGFYSLLPRLGSAVVAVKNGRIAGIAHVLLCMQYADANGRTIPCGYLYAVAVSREARHAGLGAELSRAAEKSAETAGAGFFCTSPAEPSLYDWYSRILKTEPVLYRTMQTIASADCADTLPPVRQINAAEYAALRETLYRRQAHMRLTPAGAELLELLCTEYGGGLYDAGGSLAAGYPDEEGGVTLYELAAAPGADRALTAAAVAEHLGLEYAGYCTPAHTDAPGAEPYLAGKGSLPDAACAWNIVFE